VFERALFGIAIGSSLSPLLPRGADTSMIRSEPVLFPVSIGAVDVGRARLRFSASRFVRRHRPSQIRAVFERDDNFGQSNSPASGTRKTLSAFPTEDVRGPNAPLR
jgi:hypothetical protein